MKMRVRLACLLILGLLFLANPDYAQTATPGTSPETQQAKKIPISGNVALYAFLRIAAADDASDTPDQARGRALLSEIGLTETDRLALQKIFKQYATDMRILHGPTASTLSRMDLQRSEITLYANVIHRIRTELSASGVEKLRNHLENKKSKMTIHIREEGAK